MKKIILIQVLLFSSALSYSQVCGNGSESGTSQNSGMRFNFRSASSTISANASYNVNIFFHIIRNTNGSNGFIIPDTNTIVRELNRFYNPHNIYIRNRGSDYINNSDLLQFSEQEYKTFASLPDYRNHNKDNAINCYVVRELWNTAEGYVSGIAIDIPSNAFIIRADEVLRPTNSHELGHCLNLYHTHHGSRAEPSKCAEGIATPPQQASNCQYCGDYVCDTPADPRLSTSISNGNVDPYTCTYTGSRLYNPDTRNIMSYAFSCMEHFTAGQGQRMREALADKPVLQKVIGCGDITQKGIAIFGSSFMRQLDEDTFTINNPGGTATWTVSGFTILSRDNNSIRVRAIGYTSGTVSVSVSAAASDPCTAYRGSRSIGLLPSNDSAFAMIGWMDCSNGGCPDLSPSYSNTSCSVKRMFLQSAPPDVFTINGVEANFYWTLTPSSPDITIIPYGSTAYVVAHDSPTAYGSPDGNFYIEFRVIGKDNSFYALYTRKLTPFGQFNENN